MSSLAHRSRGSALIAVLAVVLFAALLGGVFMRTATMTKYVAAKEYQLQQAYYIAETGLNNVLNRTDLIDQNGNLQVTSVVGPTEDELSSFGNWLGDSWEYTVTITELDEPNMYRVDSTGTTGYAVSTAAAVVRLTPMRPDIINSALHFGPTTGPLNFSKNVTSDSEGNRMDVIYHVDGSHVDMYGSLELDSDHNRTTFNIWGKDDSSPPENYKWWTTDDPVPFAAKYPWLADKQDQWAADREFPNLADQVYGVLMSRLMPGAYTRISESANKYYSVWGPGGQSDPIKAEIVRTSDDKDPIGPGTTIKGCGQLNIAGGQYSYRLGLLELTGDMTIIVDGHLVFQQDAALRTNGHKLTIIAPEHSITFSSNASGDYSPTWSPYTGDTVNQNRFYLGDGSILWAKLHISVEGVLMPYSRPNFDNHQVLLTWVGTDPETKEIADDDWDEDYVGHMGLFSRDGSVRFNTIKTRGVLYAGGSLLGYRLRLVGMAALKNPYRPNSDILGLAQCYISGGPAFGFPGLDLPLYVQEVMARIR